MNKFLSVPASVYLYVLLGVAATALVSFTVVSAEEQCYGQYGQQITCPIRNKAFTIEKFVKVNDTWQNNRPGIEPGNEAIFLVQVQNTGEIDSDLIIKDTLPDNLDFVRVEDKDNKAVTATVNGKTITWNITNLKSHETIKFTMVTKVNGNNVSPASEKCGIENIAELVRNNVVEGKDSAFICVKKGEVLAQLPETGAFDWTTSWITYAVVLQVAGIAALQLSARRK